MEQNDHPRPEADGTDNLPAIADDFRQHSLATQRNRQLGIELRDSSAEAEGEAVDLMRYWRILVKRRWTVLGALVIALAYALVSSLLTTPIYRASAVLQIDRETIRVVNVEGMAPSEGTSYWGEDFYQTQYELLQSRALAQRTVSQLGLAQSGDFDRIRSPSPWQKLKEMVLGGDDATAAPDVPGDLGGDDGNLVGGAQHRAAELQHAQLALPVAETFHFRHRLHFRSGPGPFGQ